MPILGLGSGGGGGKGIEPAAGKGTGPLRAGTLRAPRRDEGGVGGATSVLARTASGDVQPSAWLAAWVAAEMRSGAAVILAGTPPAAVVRGAGVAGGGFAWPAAALGAFAALGTFAAL